MSDSDFNETAIQYLQGLLQAGVTDLPAQSANQLAELTFASETEASGIAIASTGTTTTNKSVVPSSSDDDPAGKVSEPATEYQAQGDAGPLSEIRATDNQTDAPDEVTGQPQAVVDLQANSYGASLPQSQRVSSLQSLEAKVAGCTLCPELSQCRKRTVFGVGNPKPQVAFFGEGPGADEDRLGEPFVGRAGELLNKIIGASKMAREDVYIFNTVKCRPPANRNPQDDELQNCKQYWVSQLEIIQPEFIVCLGSVAARTLLETKDSVGRMRGRFHQYRGSQVVVTYHPAYLLRTPEAKAKTWDDMKMLLAAMGIETG